MGSELIKMDPAKVPEYIRKAFESNHNDGLVTTSDSFPVISLKGRRFRLRIPDTDEVVLKEGSEVPVVILGYDPDVGCAKTYYEKAYDPDDDATPPDCSSSDGIRPDSWIPEPQTETGTCAGCEHNAWGTGKLGRGKACADQKRLIVCAPIQLTSEEETVLFVLRVPPASLKALSGYARELSQYSVSASTVRTALSMADADFPQVDFRFDGFLDEDEVAAVAELTTGKVADLKALIRRAVVAPEKGTEEPVAELVAEPGAMGAVDFEAEKVAKLAAAKKVEKAAKAAEKKAAKAAAKKAAEEEAEKETVDPEPGAGDNKLDGILKQWK